MGWILSIFPGNFLDKYADDLYLIIPSNNDSTTQAELDCISLWAKFNNLDLNLYKSKEMIIYSSKLKRLCNAVSLIHSIERVEFLKILGVTIISRLSMQLDINLICQSVAQSMFAIKLIHSRGLNSQSTFSLSTALILSKLTYASPAW